MHRAKALCLGPPPHPRSLTTQSSVLKDQSPEQSGTIWISLHPALLGHNGHAVDTDQLPRCWFVGSS